MSALREKFEQLREIYPPQMRSSLVLPLLQAIQQEKGYVSAEDAEMVAQYAAVPAGRVMEALSWYTMFRCQPVGRHVVRVCRNIACSLRGAERLIGHLQKRLGVAVGETTADGRFTLQTVECLASCGSAPVMQVDETYHEALSEARINQVLDDLT
ncbi:MAG TPA: NAD(P)H-dependent oxidoreductase subunit E [Steroidobacteraceae bacterium]